MLERAFGTSGPVVFKYPGRSPLPCTPCSAHERIRYAGKGCGFGLIKSAFMSYAQKSGIHIVFHGEVGEWPGIDVVEAQHDGKRACPTMQEVHAQFPPLLAAAFMSNTAPAEADDAHWLLDFYNSFR